MTLAATHLLAVKEKVKGLAQACGSPDPHIMVVTKTRSMDEISPLLDLGHRFFGENRVQEALEKWPTLRQNYADIHLCYIGPLQTNKIKKAVEFFDSIETLDRPDVAMGIAKALENNPKKIDLLIQVNTGREPQKSGILPEQFSEFYQLCQDLHLPIKGLMCVPPKDEDPAAHFSLLQALAKEKGLSYLSMGMSQDYPAAIRCGTSCIRLGGAIFNHGTAV